MARTWSRLVKPAQVFQGTLSATGNQTAITNARLADFFSGFIAVIVDTVTGSGNVTGQVQSSNDGGTTWNNIGASFVMSAVGLMPLIDYDVLGGAALTETANPQLRLAATLNSGTSVRATVCLFALEAHYLPNDGTVVNS